MEESYLKKGIREVMEKIARHAVEATGNWGKIDGIHAPFVNCPIIVTEVAEQAMLRYNTDVAVVWYQSTPDATVFHVKVKESSELDAGVIARAHNGHGTKTEGTFVVRSENIKSAITELEQVFAELLSDEDADYESDDDIDAVNVSGPFSQPIPAKDKPN